MARPKVRSLMRESSAILREVFQDGLAGISRGMIDQIISKYKSLPDSQKYKAASEKISWPGEMEYRRMVTEAMAEAAAEALKQARMEVPAAKKIKLAEDIDSFKFADTAILSQLPIELQNKIRKRSELLVGDQLQSLQSLVLFQYTNSYDTTEDARVLERDLVEATVEYIGSAGVAAGADVTATSVVNSARSAFFMDTDVLEELDAFQFVNGDPVTPICTDLNGTVFAKDDPNMVRYTPPLHWNCKSYIVPILKGRLGNREIEKLQPSTKKLDDSIQFMEHFRHATRDFAECSHF